MRSSRGGAAPGVTATASRSPAMSGRPQWVGWVLLTMASDMVPSWAVPPRSVQHRGEVAHALCSPEVRQSREIPNDPTTRPVGAVGHPPGMDASFTGAVFLGMSVDGFIARPDGDLAWLTGGDDAGGAPDDGEGGDFGFAEFVSGIDALVMGRGTYEVIAPLAEWPYQGKPVHVMSTTGRRCTSRAGYRRRPPPVRRDLAATPD